MRSQCACAIFSIHEVGIAKGINDFLPYEHSYVVRVTARNGCITWLSRENCGANADESQDTNPKLNAKQRIRSNLR
jgi:hypothetical protein